MKRILAYLLVCSCLLAAILPLGGCGIKKKAEQAITEKIVEKALGDNVDIKGDTVTVKGEDGEELTIGGGKWPDNDLAKKIPEFKKGKIATSAFQDSNIMVIIDEVKADDFEAYLKEIKKTYTQDVYESKTEEMIIFGGNDGNQITVALNYMVKDGTMGISVQKDE